MALGNEGKGFLSEIWNGVRKEYEANGDDEKKKDINDIQKEPAAKGEYR